MCWQLGGKHNQLNKIIDEYQVSMIQISFVIMLKKILIRTYLSIRPFHLQTHIKYPKVHFKAPQKQHQIEQSPLTIVWDQIAKLNPSLDNASKIVTLIASLSPEQQDSAVKYFMATVYKQQISEQQLRNNPKIKSLLQDRPYVEVEMLSYLISKRQKGEKTPETIKETNDLYLECFNKCLSASEGIQKLRTESLLYKNFGKHTISINKRKEGLKSLIKSIESHRKLILQEYRRLQEFNKMLESELKSNKEKPPEQKQREAMKINAMKQNIRRLVQSMFETLYFYYVCRKQDIQIKGKDLTKPTEQAILDIISIVGDCMKLKSVVPGSKKYSRYYHKLMRISLELQYVYCIKCNPQRNQKIQQQMKQFYKQCVKDLEEMTGYLQIQKQISLAMMTIKLHLTRIQRKNQKSALVDCSEQILQTGKFEGQKASMMKLLGQFIKKNTA